MEQATCRGWKFSPVAFVPPAPGVVVANPYYCGFGIRLGLWFGPWGWGTTRFLWATHGLILANVPWGRTWRNRVGYCIRSTCLDTDRQVGPKDTGYNRGRRVSGRVSVRAAVDASR